MSIYDEIEAEIAGAEAMPESPGREPDGLDWCFLVLKHAAKMLGGRARGELGSDPKDGMNRSRSWHFTVHMPPPENRSASVYRRQLVRVAAAAIAALRQLDAASSSADASERPTERPAAANGGGRMDGAT